MNQVLMRPGATSSILHQDDYLLRHTRHTMTNTCFTLKAHVAMKRRDAHNSLCDGEQRGVKFKVPIEGSSAILIGRLGAGNLPIVQYSGEQSCTCMVTFPSMDFMNEET